MPMTVSAPAFLFGDRLPSICDYCTTFAAVIQEFLSNFVLLQVGIRFSICIDTCIKVKNARNDLFHASC